MTSSKPPRPDPSTKLISIWLTAKTRSNWSGLVEVPADTSEDELAELANRFFHKIDMDEYKHDDEYWNRGDCHAEENVSLDERVTHRAVRDAQGFVEIEKLPETPPRLLWCVVHGEAFVPETFENRAAAETFQKQCGKDFVSGPWKIDVAQPAPEPLLELISGALQAAEDMDRIDDNWESGDLAGAVNMLDGARLRELAETARAYVTAANS